MRSQLFTFVVLAALLAFVALLATSSSADSVLSKAESQSSVPFFLWSPNTNVFDGPKQFFKTISHGVIRAILDKICHLETSESAPVDLKNEKTPEVVVVFLENKLSTEKFSKMKSSASFTNLKNAVSSSKSSAIFPYGYVNAVVPVSSWLERFAAKLVEKYPSVSVILSRFTGSLMLDEMTQSSNVIVNNHDELISQLEDNSEIFSNQIPDLVICTLDSDNFQQHDELIGQVSGLINAKTGGNVVYMFTGDVPATNHVFRTHTMEEIDSIHLFSKKSLLVASSSALTPYTIGMFSSYWPIQIFEVAMVSILLIFSLFVGSICLCYTQVPQRFETPRKARANDLM